MPQIYIVIKPEIVAIIQIDNFFRKNKELGVVQERVSIFFIIYPQIKGATKYPTKYPPVTPAMHIVPPENPLKTGSPIIPIKRNMPQLAAPCMEPKRLPIKTGNKFCTTIGIGFCEILKEKIPIIDNKILDNNVYFDFILLFFIFSLENLLCY